MPDVAKVVNPFSQDAYIIFTPPEGGVGTLGEPPQPVISQPQCRWSKPPYQAVTEETTWLR